jgi:RNA polymerase sigma factor (sigma-70 family)
MDASAVEIGRQARTGGDLLERYARHGDRAALEAFVRQHADFVFRLCRSRLRHASDADEAAQATFIACLRRARTFRGGDARGWLVAVALNACRDWQRGEQRRRANETASAGSGATKSDDQDPELDALRSAVDELPPVDQSLLWLRFHEDLPVSAVAQAAGMKEKTAESRLRRAMERLRRRLGTSEAAIAALVARSDGDAAIAVDAWPARIARSLDGAPLAPTGVRYGVIAATLAIGTLSCLALALTPVPSQATIATAQAPGPAPAPAHIAAAATAAGRGHDAGDGARSDTVVRTPSGTASTAANGIEISIRELDLSGSDAQLAALGIDAAGGLQRISSSRVRPLADDESLKPWKPDGTPSDGLAVFSSSIIGSGGNRQHMTDIAAWARHAYDTTADESPVTYAVFALAAMPDGDYAYGLEKEENSGRSVTMPSIDGAAIVFAMPETAEAIDAVTKALPGKPCHVVADGQALVIPLGPSIDPRVNQPGARFRVVWVDFDRPTLERAAVPDQRGG